MRSPARDILGHDGPVAAALGEGFEPREQQLQMAESVDRALASKGRLLVEAGTGVGKSFAYLVPAMLRCMSSNQRIVVATNTIALQEQLVRKDVPFLLETAPRWGVDPTSARAVVPALVKGRGNYVSIRRLEMASRRQSRLFPDEASRRSLHVVEDWALDTTDGTLATLPALERPGIWDRVQSDTDNCMGRKCPNHEACFYQRARRAMEAANLLICNHAVFFADLAMRAAGVGTGEGGGKAGFLGRYDQVILDEAHNLEDAACDNFGLSITEPRVEHLLGALYHGKAGKGYLPQLATFTKDPAPVDAAIHAVLAALDASRTLFDDLARLATSGQLRSGRMPRPNMVESTLPKALDDLAARLKALKASAPGEEDQFELNAYAVRAAALAFDARALIGQSREGYVYWLEGADAPEGTLRSFRGKARLRMACAPIEVGPLLAEHLFAQEIGIVLTSATLATRANPGVSSRKATPPTATTKNNPAATNAPPSPEPDALEPTSPFAHTASRLGCAAPAPATLQLGSPFDYARQLELIIDLTVDAPRAGEARELTADRYYAQLAARVFHHVAETDGGAFVLFTSFATLHAVADRLAPHAHSLGLPLLAQGRDGPPAALLERFRRDERSVLLGAASFWQGVDVKGRALRNVVITKLPFDPPDRPLVEARADLIKARGGNPFTEDSLPRAVLRFKQGFGRLIRSASDTGRVVVLDGRVATKWYGRAFLHALPRDVRIERIDAHENAAEGHE